jgi:(p)ppGpp synthase/HD superfamily hydrolase
MSTAGDCSSLLRAARFACERYADQNKPRQKRSTIDHCLEVAQLVCDVGLPREVVAAAILHDTLEKTETAHHELDARFGSRIRELVEAVTDLPWDTDEAARARLKTAPSEAQSIKCADIISNLEGLAKAGELTEKDMDEKAAMLAVLNKANDQLVRRAASLVARGASA